MTTYLPLCSASSRSSDPKLSRRRYHFSWLLIIPDKLVPIPPSLPPSFALSLPFLIPSPSPSHNPAKSISSPVHNPLGIMAPPPPSSQGLAPRFGPLEAFIGPFEASNHRPLQVVAHDQVSLSQGLFSCVYALAKLFQSFAPPSALNKRSAPLCRPRLTRFLIISSSSSFMMIDKSVSSSFPVQSLSEPRCRYF